MISQRDADQESRPPRRAWLQWIVLIAVSGVFAFILHWARFPAALLVGPMLAGIVAGVRGMTIRAPDWTFSGAQAVIGCLIAASISPAFFPAFLGVWHVTLAVVVATLFASGLLGWLISRLNILPGTTGVWGSTPGAASAMVIMAGAFGADIRLVAFMQYLRVIVVTAVTALFARLWIGSSGGVVAQPDFLAPVDVPALAATLAVAVAGAAVGRLIRLPTPYFLGPMMLAVALTFGGFLTIELPETLLALSYALIGWSIGLRFTAETIRTVRQSLLQVLLSILALVAFCGALAWLLVIYAGVDPLTAYLATSPGGMDAIAIIAAASSSVDIAFIMVAQMMRFLIVLLLGPTLARFVAQRIGTPDPPRVPPAK